MMRFAVHVAEMLLRSKISNKVSHHDKGSYNDAQQTGVQRHNVFMCGALD